MASYSNTTYSNSLYDLNGVYFNSTSQSNSSSAVDLDALDTRYLIKSSGGTISNNLIVAGSVDIQTSLTLPTIGNVETTIQGKHPTINDGDLTIARTEGLQTALNAKQPTINDGDLTIAKTNGLQTALDNKYDDIGGTITGSVTITDDLVVGTTNIITEIGNKQDEIISTTDLTLNSITSNDLIINDNFNVDNTITYETNMFDTIVIRRFDESTSTDINLSEFQIWVNNENIIYENRGLLNGYFANWSNKDTPLPPDTLVGFTNSVNPYLFNNVIEGSIGASGSSPINAVIIKNIPLTIVNDIQAVVLYHRGGDGNVGRAIGLTIELYNLQDDPNLLSPLATTPIIERGVRRYRYNFPSINTYTLGSSTGDSISQIPLDNEDPTITNTTITEQPTIFNADVNINSNVNITGEVSCNTLSTTGNASVGGSLFLGDTNLTEDIDGLLTLDANKRLIINRLTSASVITGENNCDYLNTTFQGKFGIPDSGNDLTLSGTQINFNSDSFISNSAGGNSGNHLVIFVNGTEYRIKLENAS
jgi:hypothetical protein